jgi:hypothetical protein
VPKERRLFILVLAAGSLLRALQLTTSIGTVDAILWTRWVELIERVGVLYVYPHHELMNHPPLSLLIARSLHRLGSTAGLELHESFRLVQCLADLITAITLMKIVERMPQPQKLAYAPAFFYLSPAAIFLSAFHCNTDPTMVMFLTLAVAAAVHERPVLAGVLLGCASGIKIVPLLAGPFFLFVFRTGRARLRFLSAGAVVAAIIFIPPLIVSGHFFVDRVLLYQGMIRSWGLPLLSLLFSDRPPTEVPPLWYAKHVLLSGLVPLWYAEFRRRSGDVRRLPALAGLTFFVALFLAPGFGIQYLCWILPFAAFALPRPAALLVHGATSIYLFAMYTARSEGWPWWFAQEIESERIREIMVRSGLLLWALFGTMAVIAALRLFREGVGRVEPNVV